jgi:hypothetical protein
MVRGFLEISFDGYSYDKILAGEGGGNLSDGNWNGVLAPLISVTCNSTVVMKCRSDTILRRCDSRPGLS